MKLYHGWYATALSLLISQSVVAAPNPTLDFLQLPAANRKVAAKELPKAQFDKVVEVAFAKNNSMQLRWAAVQSLSEVNADKALPHILKASRAEEWFMRNAALVALQKNHPLQAEKVARQLLQDKALVVRSAAVEVLAQNAVSENRDLLWEEMDQQRNFRRQQSLWIRPQILQALAQKPLDHEKNVFARFLNEADNRLQSSAILGLEKLTGVRLGDDKSSLIQKVSLWRDYAKKEL